MADEQQLLDLIEASQQGILAAVTSSGYPHLTNVYYTWDPTARIARVSTTADRLKGRILQRDRHAALHVSGAHFFAYAVAECDADTSQLAKEPGDEACRELLQVHSAFYGEIEEGRFFRDMIDAGRLVVRLHVRRVYGVVLAEPPGA